MASAVIPSSAGKPPKVAQWEAADGLRVPLYSGGLASPSTPPTQSQKLHPLTGGLPRDRVPRSLQPLRAANRQRRSSLPSPHSPPAVGSPSVSGGSGNNDGVNRPSSATLATPAHGAGEDGIGSGSSGAPRRSSARRSSGRRRRSAEKRENLPVQRLYVAQVEPEPEPEPESVHRARSEGESAKPTGAGTGDGRALLAILASAGGEVGAQTTELLWQMASEAEAVVASAAVSRQAEDAAVGAHAAAGSSTALPTWSDDSDGGSGGEHNNEASEPWPPPSDQASAEKHGTEDGKGSSPPQPNSRQDPPEQQATGGGQPTQVGAEEEEVDFTAGLRSVLEGLRTALEGEGEDGEVEEEEKEEEEEEGR
eukprot:COSAG05_NODE_2099_length_3561_cov_3.484691_3_plen_365_part_01